MQRGFKIIVAVKYNYLGYQKNNPLLTSILT
jgi:hypothetical protein